MSQDVACALCGSPCQPERVTYPIPPERARAQVARDALFRPCGERAPQRYYPSGRKRPAEMCNRATGHAGPHQIIDGATFRVVVEWGRPD